MAHDKVEVLLATFNGERFLAEQLNSILGQTYEHISLLVRDDGSSDKTQHILKKYQQRYPKRISVVFNDGASNNLISNFSYLISLSKAPYVMLSDQDDVWLPDKVAKSLNAIKEIESDRGISTPILIHTDLAVMNDEITEITHPSFMKYSGLKPQRNSFGNLLVQNIVTGCTAIFNRSLVEICGPIPDQALMHDWWLALVASSMGVIGLIPESTVLYRQHGLNTLGAKEFSWRPKLLLNKAKTLFSSEKRSYVLADYTNQADAFQNAMGKRLHPKYQKQLSTFLSLEKQNFVAKRLYLLRYGFLMGNFIQNVGLFLKI